MNQYVSRKILNELDSDLVLRDYEDFECMDVVHIGEHDCLKSYITENDLTAYMVNMSIMYVNQGLLYAKRNLSSEDFDDYMMWFEIRKDNDFFKDLHFYDCTVQFSRRMRKIFSWYLNKTFSIENDRELSPLLKDVNGLGDFNCYVVSECESEVVYAFVPKRIVDRYKASLER